MLYQGHLVGATMISTTAAAATCMITKTPLTDSVFITVTAMAFSFSTALIPDLDSKTSKIRRILPIMWLIKLILLVSIVLNIYSLRNFAIIGPIESAKSIFISLLSLFIICSLGHRKIMHSLWMVIPLAWLCNKYIGYQNWFAMGVSIGLITGICSHLVGDSYTVDGVPLLYPIPIDFHLGHLKSGKDDAKICVKIMKWCIITLIISATFLFLS